MDESAQVAEEFENSSGGSAQDRRRIPRVVPRSRAVGRVPQCKTRAARRMTDFTIVPTGDSPIREATIHASTIPPSRDPWQITTQARRHTSPGPGSVSSLEESHPPSWYDSMISPVLWPAVHQDPPVTWPLENPIEVQLFRFWIDRAAAWFDVTSPHSVFKEVVPKLALLNPMLFNAVLLTSAQHIQRFDPHFPAKPYVYHERLLQSLIPYLAENGRIEDEATLVAAMLLRCFEEHHGGWSMWS